MADFVPGAGIMLLIVSVGFGVIGLTTQLKKKSRYLPENSSEVGQSFRLLGLPRF